MEKFAVPISGNPLMHRFSKSGNNLVMHHIDTRHMLSFHFPEIMADAAGHPGVGIIILDDMADILHAVRFTPASQLS